MLGSPLMDSNGPRMLTDFYHEKIAKLGPDPLREDADKELLWERMQRSKAPVGLLLMDQSAVAGIGNIYRAEILFKVARLDMHACAQVTLTLSKRAIFCACLDTLHCPSLP
jgi:formamidopyrimidine-DNA glycosylase